MIYIMNSAVMPSGNFGHYQYSPATMDDLIRVVRDKMGPWQSAIGYQQNVYLIKNWTGVQIPLNRSETSFDDGDSALIMRLKKRVVNPATKGAMASENHEDWEFAWVIFNAN